MGRILVVLLGFFALMFAAYHYLQGRQPQEVGANEASAPKRKLDHVREAAKQIEDDAQKRADQLLEKSSEARPEE